MGFRTSSSAPLEGLFGLFFAQEHQFGLGLLGDRFTCSLAIAVVAVREFFNGALQRRNHLGEAVNFLLALLLHSDALVNDAVTLFLVHSALSHVLHTLVRFLHLLLFFLDLVVVGVNHALERP